MKKIIALLFFCSLSFAQEQNFSQYFRNATFRFDSYHTGIKGEERISIDKMYEEGEWAGNTNNLIDTLNLGEYIFKIIDVSTNMVIYSRGYSSMFHEWQTTDEAASGIYRTFSESVRFPFPKKSFQLTISKRNKQMVFEEIYSVKIDPNSIDIQKNIYTGKKNPLAKTFAVTENGNPQKKVDIVILGDGYTKSEMEKFRKDAQHYTEVLFSVEPFKSRKKDFNVWAVEVESPESGINQPDKNIWANNTLGTTYNSFGSARYILTEENKTLRKYAGLVPYDFIYIITNTKRYGGGGIFQLYATCYTIGESPETAWQADYVFVHEFGHSFAGLGDEYYSSSVAYTDFYPKGIEPWEPNVAANISQENLKWKSFVSSTTSLPTEWNKRVYDSLSTEKGKLNPNDKDYAKKRTEILDAQNLFLSQHPQKNIVGAFEGAGYSSTGLYRPSVDCRMFSLSLVNFDPVCTKAIHRMIDFYTK